jgi:hypothetical protein
LWQYVAGKYVKVRDFGLKTIFRTSAEVHKLLENCFQLFLDAEKGTTKSVVCLTADIGLYSEHQESEEWENNQGKKLNKQRGKS